MAKGRLLSAQRKYNGFKQIEKEITTKTAKNFIVKAEVDAILAANIRRFCGCVIIPYRGTGVPDLVAYWKPAVLSHGCG